MHTSANDNRSGAMVVGAAALANIILKSFNNISLKLANKHSNFFTFLRRQK